MIPGQLPRCSRGDRPDVAKEPPGERSFARSIFSAVLPTALGLTLLVPSVYRGAYTVIASAVAN